MRVQGLGIALLALLGACSGQPMAQIQAATVITINIFDFYYSPTGRTVAAGTAVHWVNNGPSVHTATSDTGVWDSGNIAAPTPGGTGTPPPPNPPPSPYPSMAVAGGSFQFTFTTPGVYGFHCSLHPPATNPAFVGTITVTE